MVDEKPKTLPDVTPPTDATPATPEEKDKKIDTTLSDDGAVTDKIDKANEAAERLERATEKYKAENDRQEKMLINDKLGGRSEVTEKETPADKQKAASKALLPDGMECPGVTCD